jgi:large subunit ribosomal protein L6
MSRVGKLPVPIPEKVEVSLAGSEMTVKGPKGELRTTITGDVNVSVNDGEVVVQPANNGKRARSMWGTTRSNVQNLVIGVTDGFSKTLKLNGVGYRCSLAKVKNRDVLTLALGFSHDIKVIIPEGVTCVVEKQTSIAISGANKQQVGELAATIRKLRKPEPYKGKGVKYSDEIIRRKEGKKK